MDVTANRNANDTVGRGLFLQNFKVALLRVKLCFAFLFVYNPKKLNHSHTYVHTCTLMVIYKH